MKSPLVRAALAAGLLVVPVALEIAIHEVGDQTWGNVVFAASQFVGWLLVFTVCRDLRRDDNASRPARVGRILLLAGVVTQMAFALVYFAEHYVSDILLGWIYAVFAYWVVSKVADLLEQRRAQEPEPAT